MSRASKAGRKTRVSNRHMPMPMAAKIPRSAIGAISVKEKDSKPIMVVRPVIIMGSPECSRVRMTARRRPTFFWYLKKTTIKWMGGVSPTESMMDGSIEEVRVKGTPVRAMRPRVAASDMSNTN